MRRTWGSEPGARQTSVIGLFRVELGRRADVDVSLVCLRSSKALSVAACREHQGESRG